MLTGNYRCVTLDGAVSIRDAVHSDIELSRKIYRWVDDLAKKLGADGTDQVPFEKYAKAGESLLKPSSAARAIEAGATDIERIDKLVQTIGAGIGVSLDAVDSIVATVDDRLNRNRSARS